MIRKSKRKGTRLVAAEMNGGGDGGLTLKRPASGEEAPEATFGLLIDYDGPWPTPPQKQKGQLSVGDTPEMIGATTSKLGNGSHIIFVFTLHNESFDQIPHPVEDISRSYAHHLTLCMEKAGEDEQLSMIAVLLLILHLDLRDGTKRI